MTNPLFSLFENPYQPFTFNDIKAGHYKPAFQKAFDETRQAIQQIIDNKSTPDFRNTIVALERSTYRLNRLSGLLFNLNVAETSDALQDVAREMSPLLADFSNDIILNEELFARIQLVYEHEDKSKLNTEEKRLLEKTYTDFTRSGARLNKTDKQQYREISKKLAALKVQFDENVLAETNNFFLHITNKSDLSGIPEDICQMAAEEAKERNLTGWVFTLKAPSFGPFMKYAANRELRKALYLAYNSRGLQNNEFNTEEIIKEIANLRLAKSKLLGFETYADFVLVNRMAETKEKVDSFLQNLLDASLPAAKSELGELQTFARQIDPGIEICPWDWAYYSEKLKKESFNVDDELTRPYFRLETVQKAVFELAESLFGISFSLNTTYTVYHPEVKVLDVFDETGSKLALLYLDYFPRKGKKGGAWMTEYLQQSKLEDGTDIRPEVSLVFNFSRPTSTRPSLLTYTEVTTMLHEFGHALHGMFSQCRYQELAGTNVYRDFVELPSQLLENWAEQAEWLEKFAVHYETGEKIPQQLIENIVRSRNFQAGYFSLRQLSFGILDMCWHTLKEPFSGNAVEFERKAMEPTRLIPPPDGIAMSHSFSHIFSGGYAAGYYSYKWAEVLDADAFAYFKERGIFDKQTAQKFRAEILEKGGTEHPMELYLKFRGKEPSIDALLERSGLK